MMLKEYGEPVFGTVAVARTGNPSTTNYPWSAFTPETRKTMVFDNDGAARLERDPYRSIRKALQA